jgi:two-component SAPR family response regulator
LLQRFLNKNNYSRDIYHDLMPFKVKEILLVANLYDAYSIEREGRFSEYVLGEYHQLSLTSVPRITGVSSAEEAFEQLNAKHFDLIIFMIGVDKVMPVNLSRELKQAFPYIPFTCC